MAFQHYQGCSYLKFSFKPDNISQFIISHESIWLYEAVPLLSFMLLLSFLLDIVYPISLKDIDLEYYSEFEGSFLFAFSWSKKGSWVFWGSSLGRLFLIKNNFTLKTYCLGDEHFRRRSNDISLEIVVKYAKTWKKWV